MIERTGSKHGSILTDAEIKRYLSSLNREDKHSIDYLVGKLRDNASY